MFNSKLRRKFHAFLESCELNLGHVFAFLAVEAAYSNGTEWLDQCLAYIQGNIDYVDAFTREHTPKIKVIRPQASFLVWLDCRGLGLPHEELTDLFVNRACLALNDGDMFSPGGNGFMRLNVGTSRSTLEKAMNQLFDILTR